MAKPPSQKNRMLESFNPNDVGLTNGHLFGLPFDVSECETVVIPVPWDVTVSYRDGASRAPKEMLNSSLQVDLYDQDRPDAWKAGVGMLPISTAWTKKNAQLRAKARRCIDHLENGGDPSDKKVKPLYDEINRECDNLRKWVYEQSMVQLKAGKSVAILGGEHSVSLGFAQALATQYKKFSVIHIDAHADSRVAYEGFEFSHASILYNISKLKEVDRCVLVGIRDYCQAEADRIAASKGRLVAFDDRTLHRRQFAGETWDKICTDMVKPLSKEVYISFDIDAFDPSLCPHTGTPVPGGLSYEQVFHLFQKLVASGRRIIGFDLCEVAYDNVDEWDSVVGIRALYRLANLMMESQGKLRGF